MEIKIYSHEIDYCGVTPFDESGVTINNTEVKHICKTLGICHFVDEWDYDYDTQQLILFVNPIT